MKKKRQFLSDLNGNKMVEIPFIKLFQKNKELRNQLYQQYLKTEPIPEVSLYWENFYSSDEVARMIEENRDHALYTLRSEFHNLLVKKELPEKYYKHSIDHTKIIIDLKVLFTDMEDFKKIVLRKMVHNAKEFAENFAKVIIFKLEDIGILNLTKIILNDFLQEQKNGIIERELIFENEYQFQKRHGFSFESAKAEYRELKRYSDVYITEYLKNLSKALPPQPTPTFINKFDNISEVEIYKHFKAGLVDKQYLTEKELNEYLKAAFELKTKPETLFKLKHTPTKQKIYTVFYVYYKDISQKKHEKQKEYAALLGDYFEGYKTKIIQTNWARDYKTKK